MNVIRQQKQKQEVSLVNSTNKSPLVVPEDYKPVIEEKANSSPGAAKGLQGGSVDRTFSQFYRTSAQTGRSSPFTATSGDNAVSNISSTRPTRTIKSSSSFNHSNFSPNNTMGSDSKVHWSNEAAHHLLDSVEKYRDQYEAKGGAIFWVNVTNAFCAQSLAAYSNFTKQNIITKWKNLRRDVRYFQEHPEKFTRQADVLVRTQKLMQGMGLNITTHSTYGNHQSGISSSHHHYRASGMRSSIDGIGKYSSSKSFTSGKVGKIMMSKKSARKSAINGRSSAAPVPIAPYPAPKLPVTPLSSTTSAASKPAVGSSLFLSPTSGQDSSTASSSAGQLVHQLMTTGGNTSSAFIVESANTPPSSNPPLTQPHNIYQVVSSALSNNSNNNNNSNSSCQGSCSNMNSRVPATRVVGQNTLQQLLASMANSCNGISGITTTTASTDNILSNANVNQLLGQQQNGTQVDGTNFSVTLTDILDEIIRSHEVENGKILDIAQQFNLYAKQSSSRLQLLRQFRLLCDNRQQREIQNNRGLVISVAAAAVAAAAAGRTSGVGVTDYTAEDGYDANGIASAGGGSSD